MPNFAENLANRVHSSPLFLAAYSRLQSKSLATLVGEIPNLDVTEARKLARSAVIFAQGGGIPFQSLAQDIAYALAEASEDALVHAACSHVLSSIGNFPASNFVAERRQGLVENLPWMLRLDSLGREHRNTFEVFGKDQIFTDFQVGVWKQLESTHQAIAIRAPTSAGKSYVLQAYLIQKFANALNPLSIAYVIPSRALLHEVQGKLTKLLANLGNRKVRVTSVPQLSDAPDDFQVFVVTQERLQTLFDNSTVHIAELIVDEAQQIEDEHRGILLQHCLEEALVRFKNTRIVLITPGRQDAASLARLIGMTDIGAVQSSLRPVRQNLIYVGFAGEQTSDIVLSLHREEESPLPIGVLKTNWGFASRDSRLIGAALELGREGQSLVYAPSKSPAEKIAISIAGHLAQPTDETGKLKELADFIKKHIHPKYSLIECVQAGVGFHYGSMPTALTKALEEYFDDGLLKYLVCTSTLLHGVNLPARNIFLYQPTRGVNTPLDADGFWNLAGRAGRMSRDVQGNVFLIDYNTWESQPVEQTAVENVRPALNKALTEARSELIAYATLSDQRSGEDSTEFVEAAFTRLCIDYSAGRLEATLLRSIGTDVAGSKEVQDAVVQAMSEVTLPYEVIKKSRLVSPKKQQALFNYFLTKIERNQIEDLIPLHPLVQFNEGRTRLIKIFYRIDKYIRGRKSNAAKYYSGLALRWMRGDSLKMLIDASIKFKYGSDGLDRDDINFGPLIRNLMAEVEHEIRFQYVRYTTCYLEVLRYAFLFKGIRREGEFPNLPLHLELGAASMTMISCLELGLSRIAAHEASESMQNSNMSPQAARRWISRVPLEGSLSPLVVREFRRLGLR